MNWKYLVNDVKKLFTPAGMLAFLKSHRYTLAISGIVSLVGLLLFVVVDIWERPEAMFKLVRDYELRTLDTRFLLRGPHKGDSRIVIVAIDQETINTLHWPFPRFNHAKLLDALCKDGAKAIGMDIFFPFKDPTTPANVLTDLQKQMVSLGYAPDAAAFAKIEDFTKQADSDAQFAASLKGCGNVTLGHTFLKSEGEQVGMEQKTIDEYNDILAYQAYPQIRKSNTSQRYRFYLGDPEQPWDDTQQLNAKGILPNLRIFADAAKYAGFINSFADSDSTFRKMPLIYRYPEKVRTQLEENFFPSLAVQTTRTYLNAGPDETIFYFDQFGPSNLEMAGHRIHPDRTGEVQVNFAGPVQFNDHGKWVYTYETYPFSDVAAGKFPAGSFKDKIVYIGITATGVISDIRPNPFEKQSSPGVLLHANVSDNILNDRFLHHGYSEEFTNMALVLLCGFLMGFVFVVTPALWGWAGFMGGLIILATYVYTQFTMHGRWLDIVIPSATMMANFVGITSYRVIFEEREKRKIRGAFGMYVHPGLIGQMMKDPGLLRLGGEQTELTVMFSDVRGFTTISESLTPTELVELLNEYLTAMSDTIMDTWGTVDKYEGDAIMAFWGRPYPQADHAIRACRACLNMSGELNVLNAKWRAEGKKELNIGIGLNTGPMVVGNMGSHKRFNYTVMGDAVNLGARLEGQNKEYGTRILISEGTYAHVKEQFVCRELDLIRVKGKNKPVAIYELMAAIEEAKRLEPLVQVFADGLHAYRRGRFQHALEIFEDILLAYPNDGPAKVFAKRSKLYANEPPIGVWDGVFTATSK